MLSMAFNTSFNSTPSNSVSVTIFQLFKDSNDDEVGAQPFRPSEIFVSNEARAASEVAVDLCLNFVLANIGIVSNIMIILVFAKQGFKESMNVSMTAIAIWDLIKCLAASLQRMAGPISLFSQAKAESWGNISTVAMTYLITFVSYVSSALAAYVAVERCLCVSMPLLVKVLLTPKVTFIAMTTLSVVVFGSFAVIFAIYDIIWVYDAKWNEEIAIYRYSSFHDKHEGPLMMYYNITGITWPILSFIMIIVCTVVIIIQLRKASKFRAQNKQASEASTISDRDKRVVKMLLVIIAIYIICIFPRIALYMAKYMISEFYFLKKYHNIFVVVCYYIILFDLFNATCNLYVFWWMSSNFKTTAKEIFHCGGKKV